jgi:alpha 1,2-mannosyltransferase
MDFFEFLDKKGGFYYERWGDAPVHSIGAALFANKSQIHWFDDIGYRHEPFQHCPQGEAHARGRCWCDINNNFDWEWLVLILDGSELLLTGKVLVHKEVHVDV